MVRCENKPGGLLSYHNPHKTLVFMGLIEKQLTIKRVEFQNEISCKSHRVGGYQKRSEQSTNGDQNSIETVFSIAICRQSDDNGNRNLSPTILSTFLDSIRVSIASYPACDYESKNTFRHTIGVFSSVDRVKDHHFIIADLGQIVLKTLSPEETACNQIRFSHD